MIIKFQVDVDAPVSAEVARNAFIDFSPRRTEIWTQLSKQHFKVHSLGDTWADVTEGSDKPVSVWAHERYDWSKPNVVKWTVIDSNFSLAGHSMVVEITPTAGGSHVTLHYERGVYGMKGKIAGVMMRLFGKAVMTSYYKKTFEDLAKR
jgi:hypothetical protein